MLIHLSPLLIALPGNRTKWFLILGFLINISTVYDSDSDERGIAQHL